MQGGGACRLAVSRRASGHRVYARAAGGSHRAAHPGRAVPPPDRVRSAAHQRRTRPQSRSRHRRAGRRSSIVICIGGLTLNPRRRRRIVADAAAAAGDARRRTCAPTAASHGSGQPAGGPSLEIQEIDYAEVLREKQGADRRDGSDRGGARPRRPAAQMDDSGMRLLLDIVRDPARLSALMTKLGRGERDGRRRRADRRVPQPAARPGRMDRPEPAREARRTVFGQMGQAAGRLTADGMLSLLAQGTSSDDARPAGADVASAVLDRMSDLGVAVRRRLRDQGARRQRSAGAGVSGAGARTPSASASCSRWPRTKCRVPSWANRSSFADLWERVEGC